MIRNLIFDFGKVLVDYDFKPLLSDIFPDRVEMERFYSVFCSREFCDKCDKGDITYRELVDEYTDKYPCWADEIQEFCSRQFEVLTGEVPGMHSLLARLKKRGYMLYGLTNWGSTVYEVIDHFDIFRELDGWLISSEEHLIKPDPAIYRRLCDKFSLRMDECLFTDDKQINIDGGIEAGMDSVLFTGTREYEKELVKRCII